MGQLKKQRKPAKHVSGSFANEKGTGRDAGDLASDLKRSAQSYYDRRSKEGPLTMKSPIREAARGASEIALDAIFPSDRKTTKANKRIGGKLRKVVR